MTAVRLDAPVYLVRGSDEVLLRDAARDLIHALVGDLDPAFTVDEIGRDRFQPSDAAEARIAPLVEAAQTPPFLTDRRVVVGRDLDVFTRVEQIAPLVAYLDDPLPTTSLVLVFGPGRLPKLLAEAVARCRGEQTHTGPGGKGAAWVDDQLAAGGLQLDGAPVRGEKDAAQLLGLRGSTFPARKALQQARRLGHDRVVEAVSLLAGADLDLRGGKAWPEGLGLGGLGARLARLGRWRAAWFLWMTPLVAAESMRLTARRSLASASSAPPSTAATAALARVLSSERTALLRSWRTRFWRLRLIWLLMFATGGTCSFESDSTAYVAGSSVCRASRSCRRQRRAARATASPTLGLRQNE